jgi:AcrR family transcriptional regulator
MARKKQFSIEDIMAAAFHVVRRRGMKHLTARAIAKALGSSTMPIYTCVSSMRAVEESVVRKSWEILQQYQMVSRTGDIYADMGLGYVLFAKEEKHLFHCIHNDAYENINAVCGENNFNVQLKRLETYPLTKNFSKASKEKLLFRGFLFCHGFASLISGSMGKHFKFLDTEKAILDFFKESSELAWKGLQSEIK